MPVMALATVGRHITSPQSADSPAGFPESWRATPGLAGVPHKLSRRRLEDSDADRWRRSSRPPFHRLHNPRGELSPLVCTLVRTVPPHNDKPTGFPWVPVNGTS